MALPPAAGVARVHMRALLLGERVISQFHMKKAVPADWTGAELGDLAQAFIDAWIGSIRALQTADYHLESVRARSLHTLTSPQVDVSANDDGTLAGPSAPPFVAACISWRTGSTGRSFHGRTFHPGLSESQYDQAFLTGAAVSALQSGYQTFLSAIETDVPGADMVVLSYYTNNAQRPTPVATVITTAIVDGRLDTQNSRKPQVA